MVKLGQLKVGELFDEVQMAHGEHHLEVPEAAVRLPLIAVLVASNFAGRREHRPTMLACVAVDAADWHVQRPFNTMGGEGLGELQGPKRTIRMLGRRLAGWLAVPGSDSVCSCSMLLGLDILLYQKEFQGF